MEETGAGHAEDAQAPVHGVLETVWLSCGEAQMGGYLLGENRLSVGVGRRHPVTKRKASLIGLSMRRV